MRIFEVITESLSRIVYHYTNINAAEKILSSGEFQLSSILGSIEQQYAPKSYSYFLSTTRTKLGGYHDYVGASAVMFVLDGNYYNQRYPAKPVDYWGNRDPEKAYGRKHEAEDRLFSKDPTIPADGVTAVHLLVKEDAEPHIKAYGRRVLLAAKKRGIPATYYNDENAWRKLDTTKSAPVTDLKGQQPTNRSFIRHRGYLIPWMEVIQAKDMSQLSSKSRDIVRSMRRSAENVKLGYMRDRDDIVRGLGNEMSNARKPNAGEDRNHAVKIISYMRANRLQTLTDLVDHLTNKWTEDSGQ